MRAKYIFTIVTVLFLASCNRDGCTDSTADNYDDKAKNDDGSCTYNDKVSELMEEYKVQYAEIVYQSYMDSYEEAQNLLSTINSFVDNPTESGFTSCKQAWIAAREPYGQTEAFRFSSGPIDDQDGPEGLLNAWPLDESYVDYVEGDDMSGIINDSSNYPNITAAMLEELNEQGGEENISIGYHAIEFLLWGQDATAPSENKAGQRPYTDYLTINGTAQNQSRRGDYLKICAQLLVDHLKLMVDAWNPNGSGNYYNTFMAISGEQALTNIFTGIGTLSKSELAGERMFVALDNQDQEDEHSCFSDNTHRDIILNAQGIKNVYTGTYISIDGTEYSGTSIVDILAIEHQSLEAEITALTNETTQKCQDIPSPFDDQLTNESVGGNGPIMLAINALQDQGDKFVEAATALGLSVSNELPE